MKIKDLGPLPDRVILYGGPYSNLAAMQGLCAVAATMGIATDAMICTGDVVAYGGDPVATSDLFREIGGICIAGNCEKQLAVGANDCGCGFDVGSTCDLLSRGWYPFANRAIDDQLRGFFADLPDIIIFTQGPNRYAIIHGGITDISRFIWPTDTDAVFAGEIDRLCALVGPVDGVIAGHSGIPFVRQINGVQWINAGVIGMPPHDGRNDTRFMVLHQGHAHITPLSYDFTQSAARMRAQGLTQGYDRALLTGYWPSEGILPPELRRASLVL